MTQAPRFTPRVACPTRVTRRAGPRATRRGGTAGHGPWDARPDILMRRTSRASAGGKTIPCAGRDDGTARDAYYTGENTVTLPEAPQRRCGGRALRAHNPTRRM
jgi:hypothetical protein